jgi:3,4-dehydroadipyl-CoA semialdehyde dehydrogenase
MIELESYLVGEWRRGTGGAVALENPATGEVIGSVATEGFDLRAATAHARAVGGPALRAMSFAERGRMLKAMSGALHAEREALIEVSLACAGTTRGDAKYDIDGAIGTLAYYAGLAETLGERKFLLDGDGVQLTRSPRFFGYHARFPLEGVAVHINAFNFPAWGLAEKAATALLAGVPVITKPATSTAMLAYRAMKVLVEKQTFPTGALQFLCGRAEPLLAELCAGDAISFTGSAATGATLRKSAAVLERDVRLTIEADSLNAAVLGPEVEAGSDVFRAFVRDVAREMTQKTGQKCTAIRRIFVPADRADDVVVALGEELAVLKVGDPANDTVRMGPLATAGQLRDARAGIAALVAGGAKIVFGSAEQVTLVAGDASKGAFLGPVLLRHDDPAHAHVVHEREVFAPVATVLPYASLAEVPGLVARGGGSLLASIHAESVDTIATLVRGLAPHHGRVWVASDKVLDQATPSGMVLPSCIHGGPGRAGGGEELGGLRGLEFYTQRVAIQGDRALLERVLA